MNRSKYYTKELPDGYQPAKTVDVGEKRFAILMNLAATLLTAVVGVGGFFLKFAGDPGSAIPDPPFLGS